MSSQVLLIGYGNPLRRDDGAALRVVRVVRRWRVPGVVCRASFQLVPELAEELSCAKHALFVDASHPQEAMVVQVLEPRTAAPSLGHISDPAALLAWSVALYGRRPAAWLLTLPAPDLGHGFGLSPAARQGVRAALHWTRDWFGAIAGPAPGPFAII